MKQNTPADAAPPTGTGIETGAFTKPSPAPGRPALDVRPFFYIHGNMKTTQAIAALSALAQDTRLEVFRHLMRRLPEGVPAGDLAAEFGVPASTMSVHLAILTRARLIRAARHGRTIRYAAEPDGIRDLLEFLVRDCCNGKPNTCNRLLEAALRPGCP